MRFNFVVSPGTILKEYMGSRNITQKDLAKATHSSERHVSDVVNSKVKLTEEFAIKLEEVFDDVKAEFWMDLETSYRLHVLRNEEKSIVGLKQISEDFQFKHVFRGMDLSIKEQAVKMLDILGVESFDQVQNHFKELSFRFMEDGGDEKAMYLWLKLCESEIDIQNDIQSFPRFDIEILKSGMGMFKNLMYTQIFDVAIDNLRRYSNELGIVFVYHESIPNAKIRGAAKMIDNRPVIFISDRYNRLDTMYFAFIHELAHIMDKSITKEKYEVIVEEDDENLANSYARNFFINEHDYQSFVEQHKIIKAEDIVVFSKKNQMIPDVLLGFLEHDKYVDYGTFSYLRGKK